MKLFVLIFLLSTSLAWSQASKVIPVFLEAAEIYAKGPQPGFYLRPDIRSIIEIMEKKGIQPQSMDVYLSAKEKSSWPLPADDKFDGWMKKPGTPKQNVPEVALHAFRMDVIEESDDFFNDDIYVYFFVTDGVIPTGKVSGIYKGIDEGETFFFNEIDRAIFPLIGIPAKRPDNHLIVDYGIVESDGDDIKDLQKLTSIIIDIAITVYSSIDPQNAEILIRLRKEVKALADLLLTFNNDDRLATGTFGYQTEELTELLQNRSYVEFKKTHKKESNFDDWEYHLQFRLLKK